jgi:2-C-methyl-D-erythritol 2,4-cyclodiphosphate synthase
MSSQPIVTPVPGVRRDRATGVQKIRYSLEALDSGFGRNDEKTRFPMSSRTGNVHEVAFLFRIGFGYDAHRLVEGRPLILGGVSIPFAKGLLGHSDADVLTHAVVDAILGALAMGDIGRHFPDTDPAFKDMKSMRMLEQTLRWVQEAGYQINNVDLTIVAEKPKLAPHIPGMQARLSAILQVPVHQISVKAKTTEGMGFCGREEGMEAYAVVSLVQK